MTRRPVLLTALDWAPSSNPAGPGREVVLEGTPEHCTLVTKVVEEDGLLWLRVSVSDGLDILGLSRTTYSERSEPVRTLICGR